MAPEPRFEEIRPRTSRLGHRLVHVATCDSTMRLTRAYALEGATEGLVVVADEQTQGVGRRGRTWFSPRGGLLATLLLRPQASGSRLEPLPLAAGVALVEAIRRLTRVEAGLKWPNDVIVGDRKVAGLLVEARYDGDRADFLLLGIGVNGNVRLDRLPLEIQATATSLGAAAGRRVCMPALLKVFLDRFEPLYDALQSDGEAAVLDRVRDHLSTLGRRVSVETTTGPVEGRATGLGPGGELLVETEQGVRGVRWGDCVELRGPP